jgi:hypothetical protein
LQALTCNTKTGGFISKALFAALLAAGLIAAPLLTQTAAAQTTQPAAPEKKQAKVKKPPTPGHLAAGERLKKCGAEWKEAKAAGKIEKGMKWPKFWSACNKRLKAAG